jgi:hypothetical protein
MSGSGGGSLGGSMISQGMSSAIMGCGGRGKGARQSNCQMRWALAGGWSSGSLVTIPTGEMGLGDMMGILISGNRERVEVFIGKGDRC